MFSCNPETKFCQTPIKLADPTQLQFVGVGVDFVFPCHKKTKNEEGRNPHLSSIRGNDPKSVLLVSDVCLDSVWVGSGLYPEGVWRVCLNAF